MEARGTSLQLDQRGLDALRGDAARNPRGAARQAAVQFESLFTQMMLKSMRDATPKADGGGQGDTTFTAMLDAQFATGFAGRPGGLADVIEKQLTRHLNNLPPLSPENQAAMEAAQAAAQAQAAAASRHPRAGGDPVQGAALDSRIRGNDGTAPATGRSADFIRRMLPHAQEAERQTGVPASFILGQAALESGWGRSEIRNADGSNSFNLFGIKATRGWNGGSTRITTTEYEGGMAIKQKASFRSYSSYTEAFADYARMLANSPRYAGVVRNADTAEQFAGGMQRAGYATDPQYANKLARTINQTLALQRALG